MLRADSLVGIQESRDEFSCQPPASIFVFSGYLVRESCRIVPDMVIISENALERRELDESGFERRVVKTVDDYF